MRLLFLIIFCLGFLLNACKDSKTLKYTLGNDEVHYISGEVETAVAERLGDFLREDGYFDDSGLAVQVKRNQDTFYVLMIVDTAALEDAEYLEMFRNYTADLCREVFAGKTTDIWLCNRDFEPYLKLNCILPPAQRKALNGLNVNGNLLYFSPAIEKEELQMLSDFLVRDSFFSENDGILAEFDRVGEVRLFRFAVTSDVLDNPEYKILANAYAQKLSDSCFSGAPVSVHLCDRNLSSLFETEVKGN